MSSSLTIRPERLDPCDRNELPACNGASRVTDPGSLRRRRALWRGTIGALLVMFAAEMFTRAELVNPTYLPPATAIIATIGEIMVDPEFLVQVLGTLQAWFLGLLLAAIIGIPVGIVLGSSARTYAATRALVEFLRPIPSVALIPLVVVLFGFGLQMKLTLITYASLWPILFNTIYGMHEVEPLAKETARSFGLSKAQILTRISLPSAAPFIYTGIRISAGIALILTVSTELIAGGSGGIGSWILNRSFTGTDSAAVYAATIVAGFLGLLINITLVFGEKRLFSWHQRVRAEV